MSRTRKASKPAARTSRPTFKRCTPERARQYAAEMAAIELELNTPRNRPSWALPGTSAKSWS